MVGGVWYLGPPGRKVPLNHLIYIQKAQLWLWNNYALVFRRTGELCPIEPHFMAALFSMIGWCYKHFHLVSFIHCRKPQADVWHWSLLPVQQNASFCWISEFLFFLMLNLMIDPVIDLAIVWPASVLSLPASLLPISVINWSSFCLTILYRTLLTAGLGVLLVPYPLWFCLLDTNAPKFQFLVQASKHLRPSIARTDPICSSRSAQMGTVRKAILIPPGASNRWREDINLGQDALPFATV